MCVCVCVCVLCVCVCVVCVCAYVLNQGLAELGVKLGRAANFMEGTEVKAHEKCKTYKYLRHTRSKHSSGYRSLCRSVSCLSVCSVCLSV
jgi:hypothetical protein